MENTNKYYRYLCTNAFGYGWGRTPLEAWRTNPNAGLTDNLKKWKMAECHIIEVTSSIKPEGDQLPKNWGLEWDASHCVSNLDEVSCRYMWTDRFKQRKDKYDTYYKRSFCVKDQDWIDDPKHLHEA